MVEGVILQVEDDEASYFGQILERDRLRCAAIDVEYIEKPSDLQGLVSLVKEICARVEPLLVS